MRFASVSRHLLPFAFGFFCVLALAADAPAEDVSFARRIVAELASRDYFGRGYLRNGMEKAAQFLAGELAKAGLAPLDGKGYRQEFSYAVNTFPGKMDVAINGVALIPGRDYIVTPNSFGQTAAGALAPTAEAGRFANAAGDVQIVLKDKLTWSVGRSVLPRTEIQLDRARFPAVPRDFRIAIENRFVDPFPAANLAAIVPGTRNPDRYIFLTAHYDHLGGMGTEAFFPGANDNASGVALLLGLARHYAAHPAPESVVFLFFAGEEAGLVGSKYFVEHPLVDLSRIRFLSNFDLEGTGVDGATAVNATEFPGPFALLQAANAETKALKVINPRGKAPNSDHYWFAEKGVPAFFLYTLGGIAAYHDIDDRAETLPLDHYEDLTALFIRFNEKLMAGP